MKHKEILRWLQMLLASFLMYEVLWSVIEVQYESLSFRLDETLWDLAQCALFTSTVFGVNWFFGWFRGGRYARRAIEVVCVLAVSSLLIFLVDNVIYVQETSDDSFWNIIDIYVICIICVLLSIIDIQHSYHSRVVELEQEQIRLRLCLLQQQLSPHFLFNSLSTLQGMIATDSAKAERYVGTLSHIMRYITENLGKERIAIAEALRFIESYEKMQEARFPEHFLFSIDTVGQPQEAYIVPVSLQIAVENAIKHNKHSRQQPLEIRIAFDGNYIAVENRKQPVEYTDSLGVGLKNLNERYELLIGRGLDISETSDYYSVMIPLIKVQDLISQQPHNLTHA